MRLLRGESQQQIPQVIRSTKGLACLETGQNAKGADEHLHQWVVSKTEVVHCQEWSKF